MFTGYYVELSFLKKHIRDLPKRYFNSSSMHTVFETSWMKKLMISIVSFFVFPNHGSDILCIK